MVSGLLNAVSFSQLPSSEQELLDAVTEAAAQIDFRRADRLCQRIRRRNPDSRMALNQVVTAAENAGQKDMALGYLESIPDVNATDLAERYFPRGEFSETL